MAQRAGNDSVTTAQAVLRMDQVPTRPVPPRDARLLTCRLCGNDDARLGGRKRIG